jgi:pilus assembly protein Flp/PilA
MLKFFKWFVRDERGVSAMEYAILAGIVAVALGAIASQFTTGISTMFAKAFTSISTAQNGSTTK